MLRHLAFVVSNAAVLALFAATSVPAAKFGTAEEAKAMLERAVGAVKEDKAKALDLFNKSDSGFRDRDLYVFCANASNGALTAHPTMKGEHLQDIKGKKGFPLGQEMMQKAAEGKVSEVNLLVAAPRLRQASRKDLFLHKLP